MEIVNSGSNEKAIDDLREQNTNDSVNAIDVLMSIDKTLKAILLGIEIISNEENLIGNVED